MTNKKPNPFMCKLEVGDFVQLMYFNYCSSEYDYYYRLKHEKHIGMIIGKLPLVTKIDMMTGSVYYDEPIKVLIDGRLLISRRQDWCKVQIEET